MFLFLNPKQTEIAAGTSPESRLPGICEHDPLTATTAKLGAPTGKPAMSATSNAGGAGGAGNRISSLRVHPSANPRIDISRASSSSHHEDSRDSSPENVFDQVINIYKVLQCIDFFY